MPTMPLARLFFRSGLLVHQAVVDLSGLRCHPRFASLGMRKDIDGKSIGRPADPGPGANTENGKVTHNHCGCNDGYEQHIEPALQDHHGIRDGRSQRLAPDNQVDDSQDNHLCRDRAEQIVDGHRRGACCGRGDGRADFGERRDAGQQQQADGGLTDTGLVADGVGVVGNPCAGQPYRNGGDRKDRQIDPDGKCRKIDHY